jgi:hypothetical protein
VEVEVEVEVEVPDNANIHIDKFQVKVYNYTIYNSQVWVVAAYCKLQVQVPGAVAYCHVYIIAIYIIAMRTVACNAT